MSLGGQHTLGAIILGESENGAIEELLSPPFSSFCWLSPVAFELTISQMPDMLYHLAELQNEYNLVAG